MIKVKKCPWCHGMPIVWNDKARFNDPDNWQALCEHTKCPVKPSTHHFTTQEQAINAWNDRDD